MTECLVSASLAWLGPDRGAGLGLWALTGLWVLSRGGREAGLECSGMLVSPIPLILCAPLPHILLVTPCRLFRVGISSLGRKELLLPVSTVTDRVQEGPDPS